MTVKELREALTQYPDDAIVWLTEDFYGYPVDEVEQIKYKTAKKWNHDKKMYVDTEPRVTITA